MIHPYLCWLGILLAFGASLALFTSGRLDVHEHFYAPALLLIGFYTLHAILTDKQQYQRRTTKQVIPKAIGKYILWGLVIYGVTRFYAAHWLYRDFTPNTRRFFEDFLTLFLIMGLPYFFLAEKFRYCTDNVIGDPYLRILSLLRCLKNREFRLIGRRHAKSYKPIYLMAIIRIHYVPIMFEQVFNGLDFTTNFLERADFQWSLASCVLLGTALAWAIDANNGAIGYFWESWFTKSRFRQIDPHPMHWFVVLICYTPFIGYAAQFVPFPSLTAADSPPLVSSSSFNSGCEIALLILLVLYVLCGSTLNFSTSNLCYKKIQTKGPYAIVRHPATTFKLGYFFLAFFRYSAAYTFAGCLSYLVWMMVYICRALVEERFLRKFSDYRRYMKETRYRFIPRLY